MNTIQTALTTALRAKPVTERVWEALNEKPYSTSKQIAARLNILENRAAAATTEMLNRGMIKWRTTPLRMAKGSIRNVKEWWCVYATYERLPLVKKPNKKDVVKAYHAEHPLAPPVAPSTVIAAPVPPPLIVPVTDDDAMTMLDSMSLKATLKMYKHLHAIFNYDRRA